MNDWQRMIRETRERMDALDKRRVRMIEDHEKPLIIHAVSEAYLRERERLTIYEYCATH